MKYKYYDEKQWELIQFKLRTAARYLKYTVNMYSSFKAEMEKVESSKGQVLHQGSKGKTSSDEDVSDIIDRSQCSSAYYRLEECLVENERSWKKCQSQVKLLKLCSQNASK